MDYQERWGTKTGGAFVQTPESQAVSLTAFPQRTLGASSFKRRLGIEHRRRTRVSTKAYEANSASDQEESQVSLPAAKLFPRLYELSFEDRWRLYDTLRKELYMLRSKLNYIDSPIPEDLAVPTSRLEAAAVAAGILPPDNPDETLQSLFGRFFRPAENSRSEALRSDRIAGKDGDSVAPKLVESPGRYFAISGRDATVDCFIENLADVYASFRFFETCTIGKKGVNMGSMMEHLRGETQFQFAVAAAGLGKTTFFRELHSLLHTRRRLMETRSPGAFTLWLKALLGSREFWRRHLDSPRDVELFQGRLEVMLEKRLLFQMPDDRPTSEERDVCGYIGCHVLAARMLYAAVRSTGPWGSYPDFLRFFCDRASGLLRQLEPRDVFRFIWQCSGLSPDTPGMVVFCWDNAHVEDQTFAKEMMRAYTDYVIFDRQLLKGGAATREHAHFTALVYGGERVGMADLGQRNDAKSKTIPLPLLSKEDVSYIVLDFVQRIGGRRFRTIPKHVDVILDLVQGDPGLLELALVCMSGGDGKENILDVEGLLRFWSSRGRDLPDAAARLAAAAARQLSAAELPLRNLPTEPGPAAELLRTVFSYSAVEARIYRKKTILRGAEEGLKWEDLECAGLISLIDARFAVTRRRTDLWCGDRHEPSANAYLHPQLVRVCPLAVHALMEKSGLLTSDLLHTVSPPVYKDKLERDVGVIVEKLRAKRFLEEDFCLLDDLIGPLSDLTAYKELILKVPSTHFEIHRVEGSVNAGDVQSVRLFAPSAVSEAYGTLRKSGTTWPVTPGLHAFLTIIDGTITEREWRKATAERHVEVIHAGCDERFYGAQGSAFRAWDALRRLHQTCPQLSPTKAPPPTADPATGENVFEG
ncbi:hypothetical protein KFL_004370070 [Klebsormidium nitens]|uniref:Uncharacterized protein n=1 Tax=Klebsormidium nitens TaxID=105231 RepID=A0A1Y1IIQ8_KLENI|nr:hypothetical protein KFL_004370070 [Klebsormidium nitens]|eukprot:GAQ88537.1 hypothetical protein KFL_004370070 [Klebsormidium nitens]